MHSRKTLQSITRGEGSKLIELPVTNVSVYGALGNKPTTIRKQVQLSIKVGDNEVIFPFLVVPGLSSQLIAGTDWQAQFKMIIDYELKAIKFQGKYLSGDSVIFHVAQVKNSIRACNVLRLEGDMWYKRHDQDDIGAQDDSSDYPKFQNRISSEINNVEINVLNKENPIRINNTNDFGNESLGEVCSEIEYEDKESNIRSVEHFYEECDNFDNDVDQYVNDIKILDEKQKNIVRELLNNNRKVFSKYPGCTTVYEHHIHPIHNKIFVRKSYPVPLTLRKAVDDEIAEMIKLGIIERSNSEFCNPLRVVQKKDGRVRLCLDARFLNAHIASDNESLEKINELLQEVEGIQFMSTTDFENGYWKVPLAKDSRKYTAFVHNGKCYHFNRIPF